MTLAIPMVTWRDAREEWVVDIYSRLLQDRIIFLGTPIDEQIANLVVAELLHLRTRDPAWRTLARRWSKAFAVLFALLAQVGWLSTRAARCAGKAANRSRSTSQR